MSPELFKNKGDDMDGKILPLHSPRTPYIKRTKNKQKTVQFTDEKKKKD